jgi:hypothetical protein
MKASDSFSQSRRENISHLHIEIFNRAKSKEKKKKTNPNNKLLSRCPQDGKTAAAPDAWRNG